ncbi:hypothetical protein ACFJIW_21110 [Tahibacter sp. UC22_41]|uniref:hypothetical protein n=1 Tax=Tahibacter sp. UC22_41 TaxID=3350178 RepID=UPI0036D9B2A1
MSVRHRVEVSGSTTRCREARPRRRPAGIHHRADGFRIDVVVPPNAADVASGGRSSQR